jgi:AAHS family cis,cis-muconate transporter-like MFS transporter
MSVENSDATRPRSKKYMYYLVSFMGLIALADNYLSLIEITAIPKIVDQFEWLDLDGFLFWQGIFGILAFFVFVIGWLADLWGRKIGMLILLILMGGSALLIGFIGKFSFWIFIALYALMILATNVNLWTIPLSEESHPKRRAFNGSIAFLIGLIPLYAFIGESIAESALGWPWMFGLMGAFCLLLIVPWFWMKETKRWKDNDEELKLKNQKAKFVQTLKTFTRRDWLMVVVTGTIYICWNIAFKMATGTVASFYQNIFRFSAADFEGFLVYAGIATIVGALSIGIIMEKLGRIIAFLFSSIGAAGAYLGLALHSNVVFMVLVYYFMACFLGFLLVFIPEMFSTDKRGTATGLSLTLSRVGYVVGPLIAGAILFVENYTQYEILYYVAGAIALVPLLSLLIIKYEPKGKTLEKIQEETN